MTQEVEKDRQADAREHRNKAFSQVTLATLLGRLFFADAAGPVAKLFPASRAYPFAMITSAARDLCFHSIESARDVFGDVRDLYVAENIFELGRNAVASGDRFTERHSLANYLQIGAA